MNRTSEQLSRYYKYLSAPKALLLTETEMRGFLSYWLTLESIHFHLNPRARIVGKGPILWDCATGEDQLKKEMNPPHLLSLFQIY